MDTTISGRGFQTLPEVLFVLSSPDFKILRSQARSDPPTVRVSSLLWPELLWPLRGRRAAPSGPWAPLGSSRRTAGSLAGPSAVSGATRGWRPRRSWRWLQMSDGLVAEGPGFLSPTARRGPAGGVGDGLGVEGSQAAASGTQGWGAGGWVQPGFGAPHLGARLGRALPAFPGGADPPGQPLRGGTPAFAAARPRCPATSAPAVATARTQGFTQGCFLLLF